MRRYLLRAVGLGSIIAVLIAAGGYYAYAQTTAPPAEEHELATEAAGAWLGIVIAPSSNPAGVRVMKVLKDSPAAKASIQVGDVIKAVAGFSIANPMALRAEVEKHAAGETISVSIHRASGDSQLSVTLEAAPAKSQHPDKPRRPGVGPGSAAIPFMPGMMKGGFDNTVGGSFTVIENGTQVTYRATFGKVSTASDNSVTVTPNGGGAAVSYQIGSNTKLRGKGSDLKKDDKVVAITKDSSAELFTLMVVRERQKAQSGTEGARGENKDRKRVQEFDFDTFGRFPALESLDRFPALREKLESHMPAIAEHFALEFAQ